MEVSWTENALFSLEDVFRYGNSVSQDRSAEFTDSLIDFCDRLVDFPFKHPACEELPDPEGKYRSAVFKSLYRVIYKVEKEQNIIYLLDIFHTSRSVEQIKRLREE